MKPRIFLVALAAVVGAALLLPQAGPPSAPEGSSPLAALEFHLHHMVSPAMAQTLEQHSAAGVTCEACHGDSGDFTQAVAMQVCTDCHGSYAELAAMTPWEPNPHHSHMGELECSVCHNIHQPSVSFCDECHAFGMIVP